MDGDRSSPVIVNSLLCFVANFRHEAKLLALIEGHFPQESIHAAITLLTKLLSGGDVAKQQMMLGAINGAGSAALLKLFDVLSGQANAPVFAAADLKELPMALAGIGEGGSTLGVH